MIAAKHKTDQLQWKAPVSLWHFCWPSVSWKQGSYLSAAFSFLNTQQLPREVVSCTRHDAFYIYESKIWYLLATQTRDTHTQFMQSMTSTKQNKMSGCEAWWKLSLNPWWEPTPGNMLFFFNVNIYHRNSHRCRSLDEPLLRHVSLTLHVARQSARRRPLSGHRRGSRRRPWCGYRWGWRCASPPASSGRSVYLHLGVWSFGGLKYDMIMNDCELNCESS